MATNSQRSFASGEISPSLYQRVDFFKYATGLKKCYNALIQRHGGWSNRPGTRYIGETVNTTNKLVPYVFSSTVSYILEFVDKKVKFIKDDVYIKDLSFNLLGTENSVTHGSDLLKIDNNTILKDDIIYIDISLDAPKNMIGKYFYVDDVEASGDDLLLVLQDMNGNTIPPATLFEDYDDGGTGSRIYQIDTPFEDADIEEFQYVQSPEGLTVASKNYSPRLISRNTDTDWDINELSYSPQIGRPVLTSVTKGGTGSNKYRYMVTAIKRFTFEEGLPGIKLGGDLSNGIFPNPPGGTINEGIFVTDGAHGIDTGDFISLGLNGNLLSLNDRVYEATKGTGTITFSLAELEDDYADYDGQDIKLFGSNQWYRAELIADSAAVPTASNPHVLVWEPVPGAVEYNIYKEIDGRFGLIGVSTNATHNDIGVAPDTSIQPSFGRNPFAVPGKRPGSVTFIQQRLAFGNTDVEPNKVITSRSGQLRDFTQKNPIQANDSISFNMVGRQLNEVRHMLDLGKLVILTSTGEWSAQGGTDGTLTPTDINLRQHSYNGASRLKPVIVDGSALYVQARGSIVRDLGFNFQIDGYQGNDLTIFSSHLFEGYTLIDWAYQQIPNSIVWAVRDDGVLLGLTLVREQQMLAWHRHDFEGGKVKSVTSIPGNKEDILYLTIEREINSKTVTYIEKLTSRQFEDVIDAKFMDSSLSYDGRNYTSSHTMQLDAVLSGQWSYEDDLTITSSTAFFSATNIGNAIHFTDASGEEIRVSITAFTSTTQVTGRAHKTVPEDLRSVATSTWSYAVDELIGLAHLEGKEVSVFADRFVVSSPNNNEGDNITVTNGKITLARPYAVIHIGLPYISDLETLNIDTAQGETLADKKINISRLNLFVEKSRGAFVGGSDPGTVEPLKDLEEMTTREDENYSDPTELYTGKTEINIDSEWNSNGRVFVRQVDPLPLSVLAIFPSGKIPY